MTHPLKSEHRANRLLRAFPPDDYAILEPHLDTVTWCRGQILYDAGETISHAYFPLDTFVSLVTVLENGDAVEMAAFGREGVIGLSSALFSRRTLGRYRVQVDGSAARVPLGRLHAVMDSCPDARALLLRYSEALIRQTFQIVACNAVHSVEARCCRWVLTMRDRVDSDTLPLTHEIMAEMLGVQRSTITTATRSLQGAGLISQHRGFIVLTDRPGLEAMACECYSRIRGIYEELLPVTLAGEGAAT
jgi:CRP-like cAMP-binding protein